MVFKTKCKHLWLSRTDAMNDLRQIIIILGILIFALPQIAPAKEKEKGAIKLEDIVVSATKMETDVAKTPTNVAIISREEIEKYPGTLTVTDLLRQVQIPGVYIPQMPVSIPVDQGRLSTRGGEVSAWAVRVLVNGIEFNKANGYFVPPRIPIHDIERIEIIKSPSAVYGDQAIGGVINIITRVSDKYLEAKTGISAGGFGTEKYYAVINGQKENWQYFLDVGISRFEGYQRRVYEDDTNLYTRVSYRLDDTSSITFHGSHYEDEGNYGNSLTLDEFRTDPRQNPGDDQNLKDDYDLGALVYSKSFGNSDLLLKFDYKNEICQMFWAGLWFEFDEWEGHPEVSFTHRHRLGSMDNKVVIGMEYRYHEIDTQFFLAPGNVLGTQIGDRHREDTSLAFYLQDELRLTDELTITAGLRYDDYEQEQDGKINPTAAWKQSNSALSPKIGATYSLSEAINIFAGFNSGFKSPARVPAAAANESLDPERIYAYEAGMRGRATPWLNYETALFWNEVEDKFVSTGMQQYENAGKTRSKGVELSAKAGFQNGIYGSLSYTYQESEYVDYTSLGVSYDDNDIPNVPNQLFGSWIGYRNNIFGDFALNPVYTGEIFLNDTNTLQWDGYWLLNARYTKRFITWKPGIEFFISGENLTDEKEVSSNYTTSGSGTESVYPIFGRNVFVGINVTF